MAMTTACEALTLFITSHTLVGVKPVCQKIFVKQLPFGPFVRTSNRIASPKASCADCSLGGNAHEGCGEAEWG